METTGFDGHTTMVVGVAQGLQHPGGRAGRGGALEPDAADGDVVTEADEVVLEPDLGPGAVPCRSPRPG